MVVLALVSEIEVEDLFVCKSGFKNLEVKLEVCFVPIGWLWSISFPKCK